MKLLPIVSNILIKLQYTTNPKQKVYLCRNSHRTAVMNIHHQFAHCWNMLIGKDRMCVLDQLSATYTQYY